MDRLDNEVLMAQYEVLEGLVPPHNIEAEMGALGAMLLSERAAEELASTLDSSDFYSPSHRKIFEGIRQLMNQGKAVDLVTLKNELTEQEVLDQVGGVNYLIKITESVPSAANAEYYAGIVLDKATLRRLEDAGHRIVKSVHDTSESAESKVDTAEAMVFEVGQKRLGKYFESVRSLAKDFFLDVDNLLETGTPMLGTPSGYTDLDQKTSGFYGGDLTIVAARPAMGKTSLVLNFALNVAQQELGNVAVFSLEMSGKQLVRRMISTLAQVPMGALKQAGLKTDDYQKLADACEVLYSLPIYVDDSSDLTPMAMRGKCRRLKADGGLSLVVVDYLQLMQGSRRTENRTQEIAEIARSLKSLAKELDVPVIALSQLNRGVEARPDKRPMLSDIRESGSIEAEADLVMFLYREDYYKRKEGEVTSETNPHIGEVAELILGKHRNGPTGTVLLAFQPAFTRFGPLASSDKEEYIRQLRDRGSGGDE